MENVKTAVIEDDNFDDSNCKFVITPEFLLYSILADYGIDGGEWRPKIWEHIYEDFMNGLEKAGYIGKITAEGGG